MVADLGMVVALWIIEDEETVGDLILETEACYLLTHEIGPDVRNDGMRKPEATHDILPEKFNNLMPCDVGERHCLHPLSEVVSDNQQESELRLCTGKRTYYVKLSLHEGPGAPQGIEVYVGSV